MWGNVAGKESALKVPREQILTRMANRVRGTRNEIIADVVPGLLKKGDVQLRCVKSFGGIYREFCACSEYLKYWRLSCNYMPQIVFTLIKEFSVLRSPRVKQHILR